MSVTYEGNKDGADTQSFSGKVPLSFELNGENGSVIGTAQEDFSWVRKSK